MTRTIRVQHDPQLLARITRRIPLHYRAGAAPTLDRPGHVRAASAIAWVGTTLAIVQDDANFIAFVDPGSGDTPLADSLILPAGPGGTRQFDDTRGNKAHKLDLESCITVRGARATTLIAFGSGSTTARERILVITFQPGDAPRVTIVDASALYALFRRARDFAGTELNIEGAALVSPTELHLFSRGNGAPRDGRHPVNASCVLDWPSLRAYLDDQTLPPPPPRSIRRFELGAIGGVSLGFTDAMRWGGGMMFSAAAEASPDAVRDGDVAGSAIGVIDADGSARCTVVLDENGDRFRGKIEGLAIGTEGGSVYAVADEDDPGKASDLCTIELEGAWLGEGEPRFEKGS